MFRNALARSFDRSYQVDPSRAGWGLAIVQAHGGRIDVRSEAGRGKTLYPLANCRLNEKGFTDYE